MVVALSCLAFRALTRKHDLKKFSSSNLDKFTLFTHSFVGWNMENRYKEGESIFLRLSWHFKREKSVFCKASFCNPSSVYIRLCKHAKRFLLLKCCYCNTECEWTSFGIWIVKTFQPKVVYIGKQSNLDLSPLDCFFLTGSLISATTVFGGGGWGRWGGKACFSLFEVSIVANILDSSLRIKCF